MVYYLFIQTAINSKKMKNTILFCCMLSTYITFGQDKQLSIEISRENFSEIEITGTNYILKTDTQKLSNQNEHYQFVAGKGGKKDRQGIKERNKKYFVNTANDTLATILTDSAKVVINGKSLSVEANENGWIYNDEDKHPYCTIKLFWNTNKWVYDISFHQSDSTSETLEKIILLSIVDMAQKASKNDCDDDMETFWFILYASSLGS